MAIEWDIYLGTTSSSGHIPSFGRVTTIKTIETTRDQRAADGTLKQDILYVKKEFTLSFSHALESTLDTLDYWYDYYQTNKDPLPLYLYTGPSTYDEYDVIPKPVDRTRVIKANDNLFSGVRFTMLEA